MASPLRINFGCTMTEITRRGETSLLLGRQDSQGIGEGKFKIQDLTPNSAGLAALTARVKDGFDPKRILNPGRMYAGC